MNFVSPIASAVESQLFLVLIQLSVIIAAARIAGIAARKLGQPAVIGEVLAGLALGPSFFGSVFPDLFAKVFDPSVAPVLNIMKELGLVFLLFLIGLEFDFSHLKSRGKAAVSISLAGIALPFALGWALGTWLFPLIANEPNAYGKALSNSGFVIFMAASMCITALPILGRIMMEMNITRTRIGAITITAAAFDDAAGWVMLASVSAAVSAQFQLSHTLFMLGQIVAFLLVMFFVVRPLLVRFVAAGFKPGDTLTMNQLAFIFVALFICSVSTSLIGIFAIFGAFVLGAMLSDQHAFRDAISGSLFKFVTAFFLPIFFTYTGLRTEMGSIDGAGLWLAAGAVLFAAVAGKFGGCSLAARISGMSWRESACVGAMMNTRGLMELIVINLGYELGVLPKSVFCMLVIMAVVTTIMTTPLLMWFMRGTELEPHILNSEMKAPSKLKLT
jgi:Kef-type K+ transport system membrane component KefB